MLFHFAITASFFELAFLQTSRELIAFEPIQYVKSSSLSIDESSVWNQIMEASSQEIAEVSSVIKQNFRSALNGTKTNVLFARGERIISKRLSSKTVLSDVHKVPYANLIPLLSVSMTILLEGFQSKLINKPIGEILKGEDLLNPIIKGYESKSLLEILCILTTGNLEAPMLDSDLNLDDLNRHGEVALFFVNSVLGSSASEAWRDALMAFNIEHSLTDSNHLEMSMRDLLQYVLTVIHDFQMMLEATEVNGLPLQNPRYLFGWWLNCPVNGKCMFPHLPKDLIYSVSSSLRIYISPMLELSLIISNTKSEGLTMNKVVEVDLYIWKQIYSALKKESTESDPLLEENEDVVVDFIHGAWPILVFVFWVVSSHIWVYWVFHCCWFVATSVSKRTHESRPKLAGNQ